MFPLNVSSQVWEGEYGRLEVYPDVSRNLIRQKQYYNATWYKAGNNLDVAFAFDEPLSYGKVFYWNGIGYNPVGVNHVEYNSRHYYVLNNIWFDKDETKHGYWEYDTPINSDGKWDMYLKLSSDSWLEAFLNDRLVHLDPWWSASWQFKKQITIDKDQVPAAQTNFPVLINLSTDNELAANAKSDGSDIAFVDSAEATQYNHEIEHYKSSTGRLVAWVNITSLSAVADTVVYMYYGNAGAANQSSPSDVWDSDYVCVYHMEGSTWGHIDDSTSNSIDATSDNSDPSYNTEAIAGRGVTFDGNDDYITFADNAKLTFASGAQDLDFTLEAVFRKTDNNYNPIVTKYAVGGREWLYEVVDNSTMRLYLYDEINDDRLHSFSSSPVNNDRFWYSATIYDGSETVAGMWHLVDSVNWSDGGGKNAGYDSMINTGSSLVIGFRPHQYYEGIIDEVRISSIIRSENWLNTTYNTIMNATSGGFFTLGAEEGQDLAAPTGFLATTEADGDIRLNWTMGTNNTHTRIEYSTTASSWIRGSGTLLYNDSLDVAYTHQNLVCGNMYYYLAWGYNSTANKWSGSININNISCPGDPTATTTLYPTYLNFSWTNDTYSNSTVLVRKANDYPSSPSDGTVICNTTNTSWDDVGYVSGTHYYTIYSYNQTVNRYSDGVELSASSLTINVFDENTSYPIVNWSVHISNQAGSDVYEENNCTNPTVIATADLPTGLISILINHTDFEARIYYMTIAEGNQYYLNAYLANQTETPNYYVIQINSELGEPVEDVLVVVNEYDNVTGVFTEVSSQYTDGYGQIGIYLVGGRHYKVNYSKTGYETVTGADYFPDPNYYGIYYPKLFIIYYSRDEEPFYTPDGVFDFRASINSAGTISVYFYDNRQNTENTQIKIYEYYNYTRVLNDTDNRVSDSNFTWNDIDYNISRSHTIMIWINHSDFDNMVFMSVHVEPVRQGIVSVTTLEDRFTEVFGSWDIGFVRTLLVFLPCLFFLVVFGAFHVGLGVMSTGLYLGFTSYMVDIPSTVDFVMLGGIIATVGFIMILVKGGRKRI